VTARPAPPPDLAGRWLAKFFTDHLAGERAASPRTVAAYRDAMKLLLTWFKDAERIPPEKLRLADIDRPRVLRFLDWLEAERGCSPSSRNQPWRDNSSAAALSASAEVARYWQSQASATRTLVLACGNRHAIQ